MSMDETARPVATNALTPSGRWRCVAPASVVLLSGGMDSATALAMTVKGGSRVIALTFDYGQRHEKEVDAAQAVAAHFGISDHRIVSVDLGAIGGSALTDRTIAVPERRRLEEIGRGMPATYVPARNTIFLAYALGLAEATAAQEIVIAANAIDFSGYVDCRPEFYAAFQEVARLGTKRGVEGDVIEVRTPLIRMAKADIVREGERLGVPWALTWSCYHGRAKACGVCDSCQLRLKGFHEAGVEDPLPYETRTPTNA
jgi:7-cyano-7-deazaguanine synthase